MSERKLIIGCGRLGMQVAQEWLDEGHTVTALTRSAEHAGEFEAQWIEPIIGDVMEPETLKALPEADTVLYAVGLDRSSEYTQREVYNAGLENVLKQIADRIGHLIYISSTSVYGQTDGSDVDESSPTEPTRENGQVCLEAERIVSRSFPKAGDRIATVLRLAGIYGTPSGFALIDKLKAGEELPGSANAWVNLIHLHDARNAVMAVDQRKQAETVLVCDDKPMNRGEYYSLLAKQFETPPPNFSNEAATGASANPSHNKRCINRKLRTELQVDLEYPTVQHYLDQLDQ